MVRIDHGLHVHPNRVVAVILNWPLNCVAVRERTASGEVVNSFPALPGETVSAAFARVVALITAGRTVTQPFQMIVKGGEDAAA